MVLIIFLCLVCSLIEGERVCVSVIVCVHMHVYVCVSVCVCVRVCMRVVCVQEPGVFDMELISTQLRYSGILETIHIRKIGYPIRMHFHTFLFRLVWCQETPPCRPILQV